MGQGFQISDRLISKILWSILSNHCIHWIIELHCLNKHIGLCTLQ